MKKTLLSCALVCAAVFGLYAKEQGVKMDPIVQSKLEAMVNIKQVLKVEALPVGEDGVRRARYTLRQAGQEWTEDREVIDISGKVGPTIYSQYKLMNAAREAGKAGQLKKALSAIVVDDPLTLWDYFLMADDLSSDDANMMAGLTAVVNAGLCTQAELDAILAASVK